MSPLTKTILTSLDQKPASRRKRTGKIAQLPKAVRERINQLLDDGRDYPAILKELGPHAQGISHQNLTNWRQGGYQDHLDHQRELECIRTQIEAAADLIHDRPGITMPELLKACDTVAITQMFHVIMHHGEEVLIRGLQQHPIKYLNLLNTICNMNDSQIRAQMVRMKLEDRAAAAAAKAAQSAQSDNSAADREAAQLKANMEILARLQADMRKQRYGTDQPIQTPPPQALAQQAQPQPATFPVADESSPEPQETKTPPESIPANPTLPEPESPRSRKPYQGLSIRASELQLDPAVPSPVIKFANAQETAAKSKSSGSAEDPTANPTNNPQPIRANQAPPPPESPRSGKANQGLSIFRSELHFVPAVPPPTARTMSPPRYSFGHKSKYTHRCRSYGPATHIPTFRTRASRKLRSVLGRAPDEQVFSMLPPSSSGQGSSCPVNSISQLN
jgi:hypothetical protein